MNGRASTSRVSLGSAPTAHARQPGARTHSHSLSVGSINPTHRIDRRRKSTSSNTSSAAVAAVLSLVSENALDVAGTGAGAGAGAGASAKQVKRGAGKATTAAYASSLPAGNGFGQSTFDTKPSSAITDGPMLATLPETKQVKSRTRRASDGSRLIKGEGKRQVNGELRCDTCGKGYKHSSCLYKHLWEHTPEWSITSKLLISKHQQVQLLEAASVLVQMNTNAIESDISSPEASSSEPPSDAASSKGGSPPPLSEPHTVGSAQLESKRFSSNSSVYSQSYQSSLFSDGHHWRTLHSRQLSSDNRPTTSGTSVTSMTDDEREEMSAAFNLLSCSLGGTPKSGPVVIERDVPPVPPLPAKYLGQSIDHLSGSTITGVPNAKHSFVRGGNREDIEMIDDDDRYAAYRGGRSDDEEEGMFGKMEE